MKHSYPEPIIRKCRPTWRATRAHNYVPPEIEVWINPSLPDMLRECEVIRWVLYADRGFLAGDASQFMHADAGDLFTDQQYFPIATGWVMKRGTDNVPVWRVVDCALTHDGNRRCDFVEATDPWNDFVRGVELDRAIDHEFL